MRLAQKNGPLTPGTQRAIETKTQSVQACRSFPREAGSQSRSNASSLLRTTTLKDLTNHVRRFGLGVPLIVVFRGEGDRPEEEFYAPGMSIAATAHCYAWCRSSIQQSATHATHNCVIELHDPLVASDVQIDDGRWIPLEADLSTPLGLLAKSSRCSRVPRSAPAG